MASSLFFNGLIISVLFLVIKFFEIRFITKKEVPPKLLLRDSIIVYISVIPLVAKLIIILSPDGENLGANVIPGNDPNNSCCPVSKLKM